jgi:leucyl/phenylalanyl-tRNA--protein transferase
MVLIPEELKISRSLAKTLRNKSYEIRFDTSFEEVVAGCARPAPDRPGTWITAEMQEAYVRLHRLGYAHSVETWIDGALAGGLYSVAIGAVLFGESMFSASRDASKLALVALTRRCITEGIRLIDCQMRTRHLASLGARDMPRRQFSRRLAELIDYPRKPGLWTIEQDMNTPCVNTP